VRFDASLAEAEAGAQPGDEQIALWALQQSSDDASVHQLRTCPRGCYTG
jgi:hypothetical protein